MPSELSTLSLSLSDVNVPICTPGTKSSFYDDGTGWTFKWENGDIINYILTRNGDAIEVGSCDVTVKANGGYKINIDFNNTLQIGDILYTYYTGEASSQSDPSRIELCIPPMQESINDAPYTSEFVHQRDTVVEVLSGELSLGETVLDQDFVSGGSSATPPTRDLTFTVSNYNPALSYTYSLTGSDFQPLTVDQDGSATVSVAFKAPSYRVFSAGVDDTTTKTLYVKCESGEPATLTVSATGEKVKKTVAVASPRSVVTQTKYVYNFVYSLQEPTSGDYYKELLTITEHDEEIRTYGASKPVYLRDCMPMVGHPVVIDEYYANGWLKVSNALSFSLVGSLIEFRTFTNSDKGLGETLQSVSFEADQPLAGIFYYDLTSSTPDYSTLTETEVVSDVSPFGYVLPGQAASAVPTYMVVAPCTTAGEYCISTDSYDYSKTFSTAKTYAARTRTIESCNLTDPGFLQHE